MSSTDQPAPSSSGLPSATSATKDSDVEQSVEGEVDSSSNMSHSHHWPASSHHQQPRSGSSTSGVTSLSQSHSHTLTTPAISRPRSGSTRSARSARSASVSATIAARTNTTQGPAHLGYANTPHSPSSLITAFAPHSATTQASHMSFSSHLPGSSSTHAGGIQPSASFFHPSRPSFHASALGRPRPASLGSDVSSNFTQTGIPEEPYPRHAPTTTVLTKVSREPLLPIGGRPPTRSRSARQVQQSSIGGSAGAGPSGRVRTSLEKFIRRTLSVDATSKPPKLQAQAGPSTVQQNDDERRPHVTINIEPTLGGISDKLDDVFSPAISPQQRQKSPFFKGRSPKPGIRFDKFNPTPPERRADEPDIAAVPIKDPQSGKVLRKWQLHPSRNAFFLKGHLLTGGDSALPFIATLTIVFGIAGVWSGTTAVWWWKNESPAVAIVGAYMCLLTIANMLATALRDPGILPRHLDPDPPLSPSDEGGSGAPLSRELRVRHGNVRVKYCSTCRIYRPPRSSHCRMCDNCVDGCDHHCQWVNNCVGRRNYTSFIVFLTSAVLTLCLVICTSALHLVWQAHQDGLSAQESLSKGAGSAVAFAISVVVIWPVTGLLGYHMRLLFLNLTTIEQIRNSAHKTLVRGPLPPNPFALGNWRHNVAELLCRPEGMSWLNASAVATEDKREVNPGNIWDEMQEGEGKEGNGNIRHVRDPYAASAKDGT